LFDLRLYLALDFTRFWVTAYPVAEPSKTRRFIWANRGGAVIKNVLKTLFRYRDPDTPHKDPRTVGYRYF